MTAITLADGMLKLEVLGWDRLWCFKRRLEVPLAHVSGVRPALGEKVRGIRAPGTYLPGVIAAGTYYQGGKRMFWDVHDIHRAIAIDLHDDRYGKLIVEVADPSGVAQSIEAALP